MTVPTDAGGQFIDDDGRHSPDLAHRAGGDRPAMLAMLVADLETVAHDLRDRRHRIAGSHEAEVVSALADGIEVAWWRCAPDPPKRARLQPL